jgi:16S rRNA A1518/A1519 N6-dimethyltransferase RsmA/KsgA/DIM1 with predicted DNA glycosylase/AP lyase activity
MKIPRKELGQNFLRSRYKVDELIEVSQPGPDDIYLEIGPGEGVVTKNLAQMVKRVIAVELDSHLTDNLRTSFKKYKNTEFINEDILSYLNSCYHDSNRMDKIIWLVAF